MWISDNFIFKARLFFSQIGYLRIEEFDEYDIYVHLMNTVATLNNLSDVNDLFSQYLYYLKRVNKINKMISKANKKAFYESIHFDKSDLYQRDKEAQNIIVTNTITKNSSHFVIYNPFMEDENYINYYANFDSRKMISIYTDSLIYGKISNKNFRIYSKPKELLLTVTVEFKDSFEFNIKEKNSAYIIKTVNGYCDVYRNNLNEESLLCTIDSDILSEKKYDRSTQLLHLYDFDFYEMSILLSIGIGTLTKNFFKEQNNRLRAAQAITASRF